MKALRTLADLTADPENARLHTPRGQQMLVETLTRLGTGRSIVVDEDGIVLAGNGTVDAAREAGITDVEVIDADAASLVAVRRSGLSDEDKQLLALADNRANEFSHWDAGRLRLMHESGIPVSDYFAPEEWQALLARPDPHAVVTKTKRENKRGAIPEGIRFDVTMIPLTVEAGEALKGELDAWIAQHGSSDGFGSLLVRRAEGAARGDA